MITSVRLEGFKNFRDATLQLGPLTVIVGTNASGKSNIRDAFRFLHGMGRGYSLAEIIGEKYVEGGVLVWKGIRGGVREIGFDGAKTVRLMMSIRLANRELTHQISINVGDTRHGPRVVDESLKTNSIYVFRSCGRGSSDSIIVDVYANNGTTSHQHEFKNETPVATQLIEEGAGDRLARRILSVARLGDLNMRFLDLSPEAMRNPSIPGQIILGDRGENLSSILQFICEDADQKHAMLEWVRQLTPLDVADFDFVADQTGRILLTLVESTGRRTSAYSASDGTLRFLAIIAALMGPDPAEFYFLEEIDNGIHPTRLALLLQLIEQQTKRRGIQVVTTTHSPQMLAMLSEESRQHASLVYRLEGATEAKITRIVDIPGANEVLKTQNLARLHESGWLENAVAFASDEETP